MPSEARLNLQHEINLESEIYSLQFLPSFMLSDRDFTRRMLQTVATVAGVAILLAVLWAAREALLLVYVSALIAMGFSPLVKLIEHPGHGHERQRRRRVPRWAAILVIYIAVLGLLVLVALMVIPPLVAQARRALGQDADRVQPIPDLPHPLQADDAPDDARRGGANAPSGSGGQRRRHGARRDLERHRRRVRPHHDPDPQLLPAHRGGADVRVRDPLRACRTARRGRDHGARGGDENQRVAARAVDARRA